MTRFTFTLNGRPESGDAEPDSPLLYVLRDQLGENGTRYGCGQEQCGACRILVDGELAWSCTLPVESVNGSGILMTAYALLQHNPTPSRREVQAALSGNLCQCGAHNRSIKAVQRAAELMRSSG